MGGLLRYTLASKPRDGGGITGPVAVVSFLRGQWNPQASPNRWNVRMILGHGVDVTDLSRVRVLLNKMEEDFLYSTFTATERETENLPEERVPFFAGRLAAKEAIAKALGTGFTGNIAMRQVEIARRPDGSPEVHLHGAAKAAAERLGVARWLVSISHTESVAVASAIALKA